MTIPEGTSLTTDAIIEISKEKSVSANFASMGLALYTMQAVLKAEPRGVLVWDACGDPKMQIDELSIGGGLDELSRLQIGEKLGEGKGVMLMVFGVGSGQVARQLRAMTTGQLVVYEPDAGILRTLLEAGPCDLGGMPVIADRTELQIRWMQLAHDCKSMSMIITPGYENLFEEEIRSLGLLIKDSISDSSLVDNTRRARYQEWINHILSNLPVLERASPFLSLVGQFRGVPAFIIGAGPSLDKNIELVAEASKKGIVFCVDVAGRALAKYGAEPQVLVCLEGLNLSHLMADLPFIDRVVRAFSLAAHPESLDTGKGPLLPFYEAIPPFAPLRELVGAPPVGVGGSVSTVAFSMAEQLGCDPIVFIGQDLAFTGGSTHAASTPFGGSTITTAADAATFSYTWSAEMVEVYKQSRPKGPDIVDKLFSVPAWGGEGEVPTSGSFSAFRQWFEIAAVRLQKIDPDRRLINATEGGSRIVGFEEKTLRAVLDELPPYAITADILSEMADRVRRPVTSRDISRWARKQAKNAHAVARAAKDVWQSAERAGKTLATDDTSVINRAFAELTAFEATFADCCRLQPLAEAWCYAAVDAAKGETDKRPLHGDIVDDARWGLAREAAISKAVWTSALTLYRELRRVARRARPSAIEAKSKVYEARKGDVQHA